MAVGKARLSFVLAAVLLLTTGTPVTGAVYKWVDEQGVAHYTDRPRHSGFRLLIRDRRAGGTVTLAEMRANRSRFATLIETTAQRYAIAPALVHAVIRAESAYDAKAVSRAGAVGLMQLMPATAQRYGVDNRRDPQQNVDGGVRYLRKLIDQFQQLELALAAYNAGENAVIRYGNTIPPYPETRNYVRKVLKFYRKSSHPS
jgi:soluble lytic murein transglycosylase-like protein